MINVEEITSDCNAINNMDNMIDTYDEHRHMRPVVDAYSLIRGGEMVTNDDRVGLTEKLEFSVNADSSIKKEQTLAIISKNNERLRESLSYFTAIKTIYQDDSYYDELQEFYGIVQTVNPKKEIFTAIFNEQGKKKSEIVVEFLFNDLKYESDRFLIKAGVKIVWLVGQEISLLKRNGQFKPGQQTRISKLYIRRTPGLTKKQIKRAEENADEWTKFFSES